MLFVFGLVNTEKAKIYSHADGTSNCIAMDISASSTSVAKGESFTVTIVQTSKILKSNWKYEGPLYVGQHLGTTKLIK